MVGSVKTLFFLVLISLFFTNLESVGGGILRASTSRDLRSRTLILTWNFGIVHRRSPLRIRKGTKVVFKYSRPPTPAVHSVYKFENRKAFRECDFAKATAICEEDVKECNITFSKLGSFWYGCDIDEHCKDHGVKIKIEVVE
jgi:hypothetical protein